MKKTFLMLTVVSMLFAGAAFAAEKQVPAATRERLYNGITYFDLGSGMPGAEAVYQRDVKPYNGITAFDLGQPSTTRTPESTKMVRIYNGITVF